MKKGQIYTSGNEMVRIEEILEVYYPFGDTQRGVRAVVILAEGKASE